MKTTMTLVRMPGSPRAETVQPVSDQCLSCANHFDSMWGCSAYPQGIPDAILLAKHDHREPYPGDKGIRYKPAAKTAAS